MHHRIKQIKSEHRSVDPDRREFSPAGLQQQIHLSGSSSRSIPGTSSRVSPSPPPVGAGQIPGWPTTVHVQPRSQPNKPFTLQFDMSLAVGDEVIGSRSASQSPLASPRAHPTTKGSLPTNPGAAMGGQSPAPENSNQSEDKPLKKKPWWCCGGG